MAAAWALFSEKGFESTTVADIAKHADVARRTFFRYFPSKEAILFHHHQVLLEVFTSVLRAGDGKNGFVSDLQRALFQGILAASEHRYTFIECFKIVRSAPQLASSQHMFDRQWEDAVYRKVMALRAPEGLQTTHARVFAGMVVSMVHSVLGIWCESGCSTDLVALGQSVLDAADLEHVLDSMVRAQPVA